MRVDAKPSPLPWWNEATQKERTGFVFAMRSDGMTLAAIGELIGRSPERVRNYENMAIRRINLEARWREARIALPSDWQTRATALRP